MSRVVTEDEVKRTMRRMHTDDPDAAARNILKWGNGIDGDALRELVSRMSGPGARAAALKARIAGLEEYARSMEARRAARGQFRGKLIK